LRPLLRPQPRLRAAWSSWAKLSASSPRNPSANLARSSPCAPSTSAEPPRASQEQSKVEARSNGFVKFIDLKIVEGRNNVHRHEPRGIIAIVDEKGREKERYHVVYGARLRVDEGQPVTIGQILAEWDPFTFSILTETGGNIQFKDLQPGITIEEQVDEVTGLAQLVVTLPPGDEKHQPTI
jgi:DNA-directed RNA polymerase subunit beta'